MLNCMYNITGCWLVWIFPVWAGWEKEPIRRSSASSCRTKSKWSWWCPEAGQCSVFTCTCCQLTPALKSNWSHHLYPLSVWSDSSVDSHSKATVMWLVKYVCELALKTSVIFQLDVKVLVSVCPSCVHHCRQRPALLCLRCSETKLHVFPSCEEENDTSCFRPNEAQI